jgi:hypothetical protein
VRELRRVLSSQVGDERLHFKPNVGRQSPQSSPVKHAGSLFELLPSIGMRQIALSVSDAGHSSGRYRSSSMRQGLYVLAEPKGLQGETTRRISSLFDIAKEMDRIERANTLDLLSSRVLGERMIALLLPRGAIRTLGNRVVSVLYLSDAHA